MVDVLSSIWVLGIYIYIFFFLEHTRIYIYIYIYIVFNRLMTVDSPMFWIDDDA